MKAGKRTFLIMLLIAAWVLLPLTAYGQEDTGGPPPTPLTGQMQGSIPPVEQPLVPEGVFASELVKALKIGQSQDEAQAENMLSAVGIEPKNGWIAGYPVTPPILGEIEKGVAAAADTGKLGMGKDQALKEVGNLKTQLGLNVTPGATSPSATAPSARPATTIIYKYIDKGGVVHFTDRYESIPKEYRNQIEILQETVQPQPSVEPANGETGEQASNYAPAPPPGDINDYYSNEGPPVVTYYAPPEPYSYLYSWVPSPFWCSGFFFPGFFILHDFHRHVFFHNHPCLVSNHVASGFGKRVFVVDPVNRTLRSNTASNRVTSPQGFKSPTVQSNARTISRGGQNRVASAGVPTGQRITPSSSMSRTFSPPVVRGRSFSPAPPRVFSSSSVSRGGSFSGHSSGSSFSRGSFGGFHGGGGMSSHSGSFRGGFGGHR
jgi:Domain of unknown function (DUF4124)